MQSPLPQVTSKPGVQDDETPEDMAKANEIFFKKQQSNAALLNACRPAVERWQKRSQAAREEYTKQKELFDRAKKFDDLTLLANIESDMKEAKKLLDTLGIFKADLNSFTRYYEFMSQIVEYDSPDLERLNLFAMHLAPLLREQLPDEDPVDLSSVELSHYRLSKIRQQNLKLKKDGATGLMPMKELGTGKARDKQEEWLSTILDRLNELFITDELTDQDLLNYAKTISDKLSENEAVMQQIANNSPEQAMLGNFANAMDEAVIDSAEAHQNQMIQYLNDKKVSSGFQRIVFDMLVKKLKAVPEDVSHKPLTEEGDLLPFVSVLLEEAEPFVNCIPALDIKFAAGGFTPEQMEDVAHYDWVRTEGRPKPAKDLFVAQVVGESMNRSIPNGSWCLWRLNPSGTRQGKTILCQHRDIEDNEYGGSYTVKRYSSEKEKTEDGSWRHTKVTLSPDSTDPSFQPIVLDASKEGDFTIIAELVRVLT